MDVQRETFDEDGAEAGVRSTFRAALSAAGVTDDLDEPHLRDVMAIALLTAQISSSDVRATLLDVATLTVHASIAAAD